MFYELDNKDNEIFNKVSELTYTDYYINDNKINIQNMISMIEDLIYIIEDLQEKLKEHDE